MKSLADQAVLLKHVLPSTQQVCNFGQQVKCLVLLVLSSSKFKEVLAFLRRVLSHRLVKLGLKVLVIFKVLRLIQSVIFRLMVTYYAKAFKAERKRAESEQVRNRTKLRSDLEAALLRRDFEQIN